MRKPTKTQVVVWGVGVAYLALIGYFALRKGLSD